jgi:hypothetical protein
MKLTTYQASGFRLLNKIGGGGCRSYLAADVNIVKGTALVDDTNGYATNTATDLSAIFLGVAAEDCDNSGADSLSVLVIPPLAEYQFSVPVDGNAVLTQSSVGVIVDIGADALHVAINDTVTGNWGFFIDDIDISAEAIAAHTYGYAIGHFQMMSTT